MRCPPVIRNAALAVWLLLVLSFATAGTRHHVPTGAELAQQVQQVSGADASGMCHGHGHDRPAHALDSGVLFHFDDDAVLPGLCGHAMEIDRRVAAIVHPEQGAPAHLSPIDSPHQPRAPPLAA